MTFVDAAIAILQREGKPLHFKKLTEIALRDNLLTFVGKAPEATMQQKLNDALKGPDGGGPLTREKPGIFGLRVYPPRPAASVSVTTGGSRPGPYRARLNGGPCW